MPHPAGWFTPQQRMGGERKLIKPEDVPWYHHSLSSCATSFIGVFIFLFTIGFVTPLFLNVCTVDENGVCGAGCITCDDGTRAGVEAGRYPEYSPLSVFVLASVVGLTSFLSYMVMGRWSSGSLTCFTDVGLFLKNWWYGDKTAIGVQLLGSIVGNILAALVAVLVLGAVSGPLKETTLFATFTLQGSGEAFGWSRSITALCVASLFNVIFFIWSRISYIDGTIGAEHLDIAKEDEEHNKWTATRVAYWPEVKNHYMTCMFDAVNMFVSSAIVTYYCGPFPFHAVYLMFAGIFTGGSIEGYPDDYANYHWFLFIFINLGANLLAIPVLALYIYVQSFAVKLDVARDAKKQEKEIVEQSRKSRSTSFGGYREE